MKGVASEGDPMNNGTCGTLVKLSIGELWANILKCGCDALPWTAFKSKRRHLFLFQCAGV